MTKVTRVVVLALLLQLTSASQLLALAQKPKPAPANGSAIQYKVELKQFDDFVARQMKFDKTPGLTIGFIKDGVVWTKGYGFADLENKTPAKPESAYRLASVSKSMTAVAIMQLVEKKKIDLDAEVQTYVSYFPKKQWPVTVRQVLGHIGGISHYKNPENELHIKVHKNTREAIAIFQDFDLIAEPGTRYSYSSYGYNLLAAIVEAASGMSFGDYMKQNVWGPAGMNDTRLDDPDDVIPNRVRGYRLVNGKVKNSEFVDISSRLGGGGTHSGGQQETTTLLHVLPTRKLALAIAMNYENADPGVYLDRLFQLVTGAPLQMPVYSADRAKASFIDAINTTFNKRRITSAESGFAVWACAKLNEQKSTTRVTRRKRWRIS